MIKEDSLFVADLHTSLGYNVYVFNGVANINKRVKKTMVNAIKHDPVIFTEVTNHLMAKKDWFKRLRNFFGNKEAYVIAKDRVVKHISKNPSITVSELSHLTGVHRGTYFKGGFHDFLLKNSAEFSLWRSKLKSKEKKTYPFPVVNRISSRKQDRVREIQKKFVK